MNETRDLRVFADYDLNHIRDYLREEEVKALEALREAISKDLLEDPELEQWCTDATLCRFLRARNWGHNAALSQLEDTLKWRAEVRELPPRSSVAV
jgi:hypothetical protein